MLKDDLEGQEQGLGSCDRPNRRVRADAQRNLDVLVQSAKAVFAAAGVDAPVRKIAETAGVGLGTVYRHFPRRADLIMAVVRHEVDACAEAASVLATEYEPGDALVRWIERYMEFIAAKRGLAKALYSGNPTYNSLPSYFMQQLRPALGNLLEAAAAAGIVRGGMDPDDLLLAIANLCAPAYDVGPERTRRMVVLLIDGLRYGAG